jgi:cytochrome P450
VNVGETVMHRIVEPAALRLCQWRGDPVARLMLPETRVDPYPLYTDLRRRGLVHSPLGTWATATHSTATQVLLDKRFSSSPVHRKGYQPPAYRDDDPRADLPADDLLTMDPPDHTRIRRLVSGAFSPKAIAALEPWIREVTERLIMRADPVAGFDIVDTVAFPLPIAVICHLLGVPAEDEASFRVWGNDVAAMLEPQTDRAFETRARSSERALTAYLRELVAKRRADPDESLLSALIAAEEEGDRLSLDELVSTALLLLVAGFETTVNLIGNGTVALLAAPEQWDRLREEPAMLPAAVEELLRYDSPVQMTSRTATEDLELDDARIARGASIIVAIGGANRDPAVFEQPDRLKIDRPDANRHLSFSLGLHHCLGAALARLEGRIALEGLTRRYPRLELATAPTRRPLLVLRGFESIPVRAPSGVSLP